VVRPRSISAIAGGVDEPKNRVFVIDKHRLEMPAARISPSSALLLIARSPSCCHGRFPFRHLKLSTESAARSMPSRQRAFDIDLSRT